MEKKVNLKKCITTNDDLEKQKKILKDAKSKKKNKFQQEQKSFKKSLKKTIRKK